MAQAITAALFHQPAHRRGPVRRGADAGVRDQLQPGREHVRPRLRPADRPVGLHPRRPIPNRKPFPTKDGYIGLLPYTDQQWDQFFEIAGWGETFGKDPRFSDYRTRAPHIARALRPGRRGHPHPHHRRVAGPAEAAADPGGADEPARRPARRSAPGRRRPLRALRASGGRRLHRHAPAGAVTPPPRPTSAAIRPGSASTPTRCWPRSRSRTRRNRRVRPCACARSPSSPRTLSRSPSSSARCSGLKVGFRDPGVEFFGLQQRGDAGRRRVPRGGGAVPRRRLAAPATSPGAAATPATW